MCTAGKWSRMKYFSVAHEPLASVQGFSRNLLISSFKNITRVSPGVCWPVLILQPTQQRSSHHTDPRHCWHLRPTGTAVWICRGVVTYGSRKRRKRRKNSPSLKRMQWFTASTSCPASISCVLERLFLFLFWYVLHQQPSYKRRSVPPLTS